ncbi:MAG: hypothetical protein IH914_08815, partial [candidate division Zixibacteria bacterium]|nr:hypothetical protein [candidate division Zixibacteria bacterium]
PPILGDTPAGDGDEVGAGRTELHEGAARLRRPRRCAPAHGPRPRGVPLIERNDRVSYAKGLVKRALEFAPNNGAYLDSYAWALYQEGDYRGSLDTLRRALEQIKSDPTVFDHIGDTFNKLNQPDSARVYWERALELDSANAAIQLKLDQ